MSLVLVRGAGDIGSTVALHLRRAAHAVVIHDGPRPAHARRGMAFTDAFFEGHCFLDGVLAKRASSLESLGRMLACGHALPVIDVDFGAALAALAPDVLVDARMRKHDTPESLRGLAALTIGLGPGFVAGENADVVVETAWGEHLGAVIRSGRASAYSGEPRRLGGYGRERYVYAPAGGTLRSAHAIGATVQQGEEVARIADSVIFAPLSGILRGISHDGACVAKGTKVLEVDPTGNRASAFGIGERPARIAAGVSSAVPKIQEVA